MSVMKLNYSCRCQLYLSGLLQSEASYVFLSQHPLAARFKIEVPPILFLDGAPCMVYGHFVHHMRLELQASFVSALAKHALPVVFAADQSGDDANATPLKLDCDTSGLYCVFAGPYAWSHPSMAGDLSSWVAGGEERAALTLG